MTVKITLELAAGPRGIRRVTKYEVQCNIDALERAADKANAVDMVLLLDTASILRAIQKQLPDPLSPRFPL